MTELKTIQEFYQMVDDGEDYINSFDHNSDMHFTLQNFSNWMRNTKRTYKFCFPIHPIVWQVVLHLIPKQEDEDLDWKMYAGDRALFSDCALLKGQWRTGTKRTFYVPLTLEQYKEFKIEVAKVVGNNDINDYAVDYNIIKNAVESIEDVSRKYVKWCLTLMGYWPDDEETPPLFKEDSANLLPENKEVDINTNRARFSAAVWADKVQEKTIMFAGLGGIGSWSTLMLSRLQPKKLILFDGDSVDGSNLGGQLFSKADVGSAKTTAMSNIIHNYSNYYSIFAYNERITEQTEATDIMMSGFDNMDARKVYFKLWKMHVRSKPLEERAKCLYIDGRMSVEYFQVFCLKGDDDYGIRKYEKYHLFDSSEAEHEVCSLKQTSHIANMIGSVITNLFSNFVANEVVPFLRDLPEYTEFNADSMTLIAKQL